MYKVWAGIALLWAQGGDTLSLWKYEGLLGFQAAQTALTNWQAGGQNQLSFGLQGRLKVSYHQKRTTLSLESSGQYGLLRVVPQRTYRKTQDFWLTVVQYERNLDTAGRWAFSFLGDARTQWTPTYTYVGDSVVKPAKSAFLAPLYGQFSVGVRYKVFSDWTLTLSPLSGRVTYVRLQYLADRGAFGLHPAELAPDSTILRPARKTLWEVGGRLTSRLSITPTSGLKISHFLDIFGSYTQAPWGPVVVSQLQAVYKLKGWLALTLSQQAIYDPRQGKGKEALQLLSAWSVGITLEKK